jgi:NAD(P)-dependent dehydrogenase (short-subunit alcohol dehydrogenase family)
MAGEVPETRGLEGRRILVVGASSGIGRVVGHYLCDRGAHVAFAARRVQLCEEAAKDASGTAVGLACDVTDPAMCERVVEETVERLGGLDDIVYSTGLIAMVALADADADWWTRTLATNVIGASLVTRAALPYLRQGGGTVVYLSSVSSVGGPWPGIGVYTASKAALNRMIESWRSEHPEIGFARVLVGPTDQGATTAEADPGAFEHSARWGAMGLTSGALADPTSIAAACALALADPARIWDVTVQPRDPALPWGAQDMTPLA